MEWTEVATFVLKEGTKTLYNWWIYLNINSHFVVSFWIWKNLEGSRRFKICLVIWSTLEIHVGKIHPRTVQKHRNWMELGQGTLFLWG